MKKYYLLAMALAAMVSCTSDDFVGDQSIRESNENTAISFGFDVPTVTRAGGSAAATALSNQFIVYGEKSETSDGAAPATGNLVFQNYKVAYTPSTAYTTQSNTKDWEYVGQQWTNDEQSHITISTTDVQTIKYWDYGASNYVFTAVSASPEDIANGLVSITKTTTGTNSSVYNKGYSITLAKNGSVYPTLNKLYFSDRQVISTTDAGTDREAVNKYGGNVTLTFRNLVSQVRAGVYETLSGYDVVGITFYVTDGDDEGTDLDATTDHAFGAICPNTKASNYEGTLTVTYYTNSDGDIENQPKVTASGTAATDLILGDNYKNLDKATDKVLGKTANAPTWDTGTGDYTEVLPQINNSTNLKLKVDYILWNHVTGETINVKGATAEVPGQYLAWKPNYKYTYLFKISDNSNGQTGTGTTPAGLYPITFDAVVVEAESGQAEYITTVSEPSITTFGVGADGKYVKSGSSGSPAVAYDYPANSDIYAIFMEGSTVKTPTVGTSGAQHVNVFKVTTTDAALYPITEASVAEAIANPASMSVDIYTYAAGTYTKVTDATTLAAGTTYYKADEASKEPGAEGYVQTEAIAGTDYKVGAKLNVTNVTADASTNFSAVPAKVETVPGEDGVDKTIDALKLTGVKAGTYAIEYEASTAWTGEYKKVYKIVVVQ